MNKSRILVRFQSLNYAVDAAIESTLTTSHIFNNMYMQTSLLQYAQTLCPMIKPRQTPSTGSGHQTIGPIHLLAVIKNWLNFFQVRFTFFLQRPLSLRSATFCSPTFWLFWFRFSTSASRWLDFSKKWPIMSDTHKTVCTHSLKQSRPSVSDLKPHGLSTRTVSLSETDSTCRKSIQMQVNTFINFINRNIVCLFAWGLTALSAQAGYIAP